MTTASIASTPNRVRLLAAIGGLLPGLRAASAHTVRVIWLTGPAAMPTAVAVDEITARDRASGWPIDRWDLVLADADRRPGDLRRRRRGRTIVLAVASKPIDSADVTVDCV